MPKSVLILCLLGVLLLILIILVCVRENKTVLHFEIITKKQYKCFTEMSDVLQYMLDASLMLFKYYPSCYCYQVLC